MDAGYNARKVAMENAGKNFSIHGQNRCWTCQLGCQRLSKVAKTRRPLFLRSAWATLAGVKLRMVMCRQMPDTPPKDQAACRFFQTWPVLANWFTCRHQSASQCADMTATQKAASPCLYSAPHPKAWSTLMKGYQQSPGPLFFISPQVPDAVLQLVAVKGFWWLS